MNDVGFESREEINDASLGGHNYGWPIEEGLVAAAQFEKPVYVYNHTTSTTTTDSTGCAITGGVFFEPLQTNYPQAYIGKYFFMDYCGKWINMIDPISGSGRKTFATKTPRYPIAIDHHPDGNLYYLTRQNGSIYKIVYSGQPVPIITRQPEFVKVMVGQELKIPVSVSGAEPMTYIWKKNGVVVSAAKGNELATSNVQYADSGMYTLTITNAFGVGETKPIKVQVIAYNSAPVAMIDQVLDLTFQGGQTYKILGHATDLEDGQLSGAGFSWSVDLYHGTHIHDGMPVSGNENMEFTIPVAGGHTETNIFYRVTLLVKDSKGLMDTAYIDLYPEIVDITIKSEPSGLQFTLDGTPYVAPYTFKTVKGIRRTLGALDAQSRQDTLYQFQTWQHSASSLNFIEPLSNSTYSVQYQRASVTGLDLSQDIGFKVYPNPIDESFIIEVPEGGTLHLLDAKGRMVMGHLPIHTGENKIDLNLDRGLYLLVYKCGASQKQIRIMKE